jgi:hypothetical protein
MVDQRLLDEARRRMFRLAHPQADCAMLGIARYAGEQLAQFFKGIGLQFV